MHIMNKNNMGEITLASCIKIYYKTIAIKTLWDWFKDGHISQWIRIVKQLYGPLIMSKVTL